MSSKRDEGLVLNPKFDRDGLITAVVSDSKTGELLMLAHMNAEALRLTVDTRRAHFWSRSRASLWMKGETSGHVLHVEDIRIDCDQDAVWLICTPHGPACHTGRVNCFYRRIVDDRLEWTDASTT